MSSSMFTRSQRLIAAAAAAAAMGVPSLALAQSAAKTERVVVSFRAGAAEAARAAIAKAGGRIVLDLTEDEGFAAELSPAAIAVLKRSAAVRSIEADPPRYLLGVAKGVTRHSSRSALNLAEQVPYGISMVQADQLTFSAANAPKLCIVDSGIDIAHEDLQDGNITGVNFSVEGDWNTDEVHHGTHVAGTIAALGGNGVGVVGVVPTGQLPLQINKVFPGRSPNGGAPSTVILKAVRNCVQSGAKIISMSLGGAGSTNFEASAYQRFANRGVLVIAAAGNAGDTSTSFPAGYPSVMSVAAIDASMAHAAFSQTNADVEISAPGVQVLSTVPTGTGIDVSLTVGGSGYAATPTDGPAGSASAALYDFGTGELDDPGVAGKMCLIARGNIPFGDKVTQCEASGGVGAIIYNNEPGVINATLSGAAVTIPSVTITQADGATLLTKLGQTASLAMTASNYANNNGTSMATPHVSGVAALVWSRNPQCTNEQIRASLTKSAMDLGAAGRDNTFGYGLVQAKAAHDRIASMGCGN
jgi:subtilisin family serine protease